MAVRNYTDWSNEQLIARVSDLEKQLRAQNELSGKRAKEHQVERLHRGGSHRVFDSSKYNTRHIALKIAYLGQCYNGFEWHANNKTPFPTIEEELWKALVKTKLIFKDENKDIDWEGCDYSKAGRTDKGVSAFGNVIGIRVRSARPKVIEATTEHGTVEEDSGGDGKSSPELEKSWDAVQDELSYPRLLNRVLPPDIRVLAWCPSVPDSFSARFSCRQRRYNYYFTQPAYCPVPDALVSPKGRRHGAPERDGWLDTTAMQDAARRFEGLHDFRNFCKANPSQQISNFERRVAHAGVDKVQDSTLGLPFLDQGRMRPLRSEDPPTVYAFTVWGSAFLWHQVRHMVAIIFLIGQGLEKPELVDKLLDVEALPEKPMYEMADGHPLVLWDCRYPDLGAEHCEEEDVLQWIYPDGQTEAPKARDGLADGRYGHNGINEVLWSSWQRRKIDEVLAGQLLDVVAQQESHRAQSMKTNHTGDNTARARALRGSENQPVRIFDGGSNARQMGNYTPVLQRNRVQTPESSNARWRDKMERRAADVGVDEDGNE